MIPDLRRDIEPSGRRSEREGRKDIQVLRLNLSASI